jgi:hypothetical protein
VKGGIKNEENTYFFLVKPRLSSPNCNERDERKGVKDQTTRKEDQRMLLLVLQILLLKVRFNRLWS